jgi:hypothetical protein
MKKTSLLLHECLSVTLVIMLALLSTAASSAPIALVGGWIVDGTGRAPIEQGVLVMDHDVIVSIGTAAEVAVPKDAVVMDVTGQTVMPGLIDGGVRLDRLGAVNTFDFNQHFKNLTERVVLPLSAKELLYSGVTSARDVSGKTGALLNARRQINSWKWPGPRLRISGAWLLAKPHPELDVSNVIVERDGIKEISDQAEAGVDVIVIAGAQEWGEMRLKQVIQAIKRKGLRTIAVNLTPQDALIAINAGIRDLMNLPVSLEQTVDPKLISAIAEYKFSSTPIYWAVSLGQCDPRLLREPWQSAVGVSSTLPPLVAQYLRYRQEQWSADGEVATHLPCSTALPPALAQLKAAGVRFTTASFAGQAGLYMATATRREMAALIAWGGLTPLEAIQSATADSARFLGIDAGILQKGAVADILVVQGDVSQDITRLSHLNMLFESGIRYR